MAVPGRALRAAADPGLRPEGGSRQKGRAAGGGHSPARSRHNGDGAEGGHKRASNPLPRVPGGFALQPGAAP